MKKLPTIHTFSSIFCCESKSRKAIYQTSSFPKSFLFFHSHVEIFTSVSLTFEKFHIVIFRFPQKVLKNHVIHFVKLIRFFYQRCILKSTKETYFMFFIPSSKRSNFSLLHLLFGPI